MRQFISVCSLVTLLISCSHSPTKVSSIDYTNLDSGLIDTLIAEGSNPEKQHWISYTLDCKTEQQVKDIIAKTTPLGFEDDYISYSEKRRAWSSTLSLSMKLNQREISSNRALILPFVPENGCDPIFFGSGVVK